MESWRRISFEAQHFAAAPEMEGAFMYMCVRVRVHVRVHVCVCVRARVRVLHCLRLPP